MSKRKRKSRLSKGILSKSKQDRLRKHFVAGTTVRCTADLVGVNLKYGILFSTPA